MDRIKLGPLSSKMVEIPLQEKEQVMDISNIIDNDCFDDSEKKVRLLGFLLLEYRYETQTDFDMQVILNSLRCKFCVLSLIVEQLRTWCAENHMMLYTTRERVLFQHDGRA